MEHLPTVHQQTLDWELSWGPVGAEFLREQEVIVMCGIVMRCGMMRGNAEWERGCLLIGAASLVGMATVVGLPLVSTDYSPTPAALESLEAPVLEEEGDATLGEVCIPEGRCGRREGGVLGVSNDEVLPDIVEDEVDAAPVGRCWYKNSTLEPSNLEESWLCSISSIISNSSTAGPVSMGDFPGEWDSPGGSLREEPESPAGAEVGDGVSGSGTLVGFSTGTALPWVRGGSFALAGGGWSSEPGSGAVDAFSPEGDGAATIDEVADERDDGLVVCWERGSWRDCRVGLRRDCCVALWRDCWVSLRRDCWVVVVDEVGLFVDVVGSDNEEDVGFWVESSSREDPDGCLGSDANKSSVTGTGELAGSLGAASVVEVGGGLRRWERDLVLPRERRRDRVVVLPCL